MDVKLQNQCSFILLLQMLCLSESLIQFWVMASDLFQSIKSKITVILIMALSAVIQLHPLYALIT